jgi:uncharacterized protein
MPLETARKAIDYLAAHSSQQIAPAVTFYGGEPLRRFPFIVKCVEYTHEALAQRSMSFSVTTNGTLVTAEIAGFLASQDFNVTVSIDGPKDIHDEYRVYRNGRGSFDSAMAGLRRLVEAYGKRADEKLILSMVYTPPFSSRRLEHVAALWKENLWLGNIRPTITYPQSGSIPREKLPTGTAITDDKPLYKWAADSYSDSYGRKQQPNPLTKEATDRTLLRILRRPIYERPTNRIHLNGCCVPGARKIYVTTGGNLAVCERVHNASPYIGHIDTGIDIKLLRRAFVADYAAESLRNCAKCWAQRLCGICYTDTFSDQGYDHQRKQAACEGVRGPPKRILNCTQGLCTSILGD